MRVSSRVLFYLTIRMFIISEKRTLIYETLIGTGLFLENEDEIFSFKKIFINVRFTGAWKFLFDLDIWIRAHYESMF